MDWANLGQPCLLVRPYRLYHVRRKCRCPIRPVLGINRISSMCLSIFLNFFCTYHPRTPPKGICGLLKMVPPKIEPKHGLLDINRIDSMHLSTPASKSNDWCVVFFYVRCQIHSDVIDSLMKFLLLLCCI